MKTTIWMMVSAAAMVLGACGGGDETGGGGEGGEGGEGGGAPTVQVQDVACDASFIATALYPDLTSAEIAMRVRAIGSIADGGGSHQLLVRADEGKATSFCRSYSGDFPTVDRVLFILE